MSVCPRITLAIFIKPIKRHLHRVQQALFNKLWQVTTDKQYQQHASMHSIGVRVVKQHNALISEVFKFKLNFALRVQALQQICYLYMLLKLINGRFQGIRYFALHRQNRLPLSISQWFDGTCSRAPFNNQQLTLLMIFDVQ